MMAGLSVKTYRYYDPATRGLDFEGSIILFDFFIYIQPSDFIT